MLDASIYQKICANTGLNIESPSVNKANIATYLRVYAHLWSTASAATTTTIDCVPDTYTIK